MKSANFRRRRQLPPGFLGQTDAVLAGDNAAPFQDLREEIIKAQVPQKVLYHYSSQLRSLTGGRGVHSESFSHYEEMPRELEQRVIAESAHRRSTGD
jgi:translation elongation factor EF-G